MFKSSKVSISSFLILFFLLASLASGRKLLMIHELFRHGARYPVSPQQNDYSGYSTKQKENGELTLQGKHMHYVLGKLIYDKYWTQLFEGTQYMQKYHPSQFYVKSTNVNRTIESVQAHLLGLLQKLPPSILPVEQMQYSMPPMAQAEGYVEEVDNDTSFKVYGGINTDFHMIPIHTEKQTFVPESSSYRYRANPYDEGDYLVKYESENCPNQKFWGKENLASDHAMRIKNSKEVKAFLNELGQVVSQTVRYEEAYTYIDDYICAKYLGQEYLSFYGKDDTDRTADFVMLSSTLFKLFYSQDQIKTSNSQLLQVMLYNMKQSIIGKGPKMVIYSAHDTTVLSLGAALNFLNISCLLQYYYDGADNSDTCINKWPVFATNYVVQLWEEDNLSHSISILYNGVERKIPICGYRTSCSFKQFQDWVNDFVLEDPNTICGIHEQYLKLYIVIAALSLLAFVILVFYLRGKYKKKFEEKMVEMEEKKGYFEQFDEKEAGSHQKEQKE